MPSYEATASAMMYQFFPGELFTQGKEIVDAAGLHSAIVIPANFYSEPEWQNNRADASFPTHTIELRATLRLYDTVEAAASLYPELDANSSMAVYQSPRTWRDPLIYRFDTVEAPGGTNANLLAGKFGMKLAGKL